MPSEDLDPFSVEPDVLGRVSLQAVAGQEYIVVRTRGRGEATEVFLGIYSGGDLDAYSFLTVPGAISLKGDKHWVLAGPVARADVDVEVTIEGKPAPEVNVSDSAWLAVVPASELATAASVVLRYPDRVRRHRIRLPRILP